MARIACLPLLFLVASAQVSKQQQRSLLQTYERALNGNVNHGKETPVTRVVNLLKEMENTLNGEMDEDEALYQKLSCWCTSGMSDKEAAISAATEKIAELDATIQELTAKSAELKENIASTEQNVANSKQVLATATAQRQKAADAFHHKELDSIQNLENMKAALTVLDKHHGAAFPQLGSLSLIAVKGRSKFLPASERNLDEFMQTEGYGQGASSAAEPVAKVQEQSNGAWSAEDIATVRRALHSSFVQNKYNPGYESQSGEIVGVVKTMVEQMSADLKAAQEQEAKDAAAFEELRTAKTAEIEAGEAKAERKEDVKAETDVKNAEAAEDKEQTAKIMSEDQQFVVSLQKTCKNADTNFEARKKARLEEIKAVSETIGILTSDDARDNMGQTYGSAASFVQRRKEKRESRKKAMRVVMKAHGKLGLMTRAQMDDFAAIKKVMADMVSNLEKQQAEEVAKNDECKKLIHENEMDRLHKQDDMDALDAQIHDHEETIKKLATRIDEAKHEIATVQVALQKASEDRKAENMEFQKTVGDQEMTIAILHKAMERLSKYYDAAFVQKKQTPPVPQMEYKPSSGAGGVMSMIEKLIYDAKEMMQEARKDESEAQAAYEDTVVESFASVKTLMKEVSTKVEDKAETEKSLVQAQQDLKDATNDLHHLEQTKVDIHGDCDYLMRNFDARQTARAAEIEVLQKEAQILSGAQDA